MLELSFSCNLCNLCDEVSVCDLVFLKLGFFEGLCFDVYRLMNRKFGLSNR